MAGAALLGIKRHELWHHGAQHGATLNGERIARRVLARDQIEDFRRLHSARKNAHGRMLDIGHGGEQGDLFAGREGVGDRGGRVGLCGLRRAISLPPVYFAVLK
jgi:hypothetical protein